MKQYGIYKSCRDAAWRCLLTYEVKELPVRLNILTRRMNIKLIRNQDIHILESNETGRSFYKYENDKWCIVYNDDDTIQRCRQTVAHELGHIVLGHMAGISTVQSNRKKEKEADSFAMRLLAPACVLWGLELRTAQEIAKVCNIMPTIAYYRARRMATLYRRNQFLSSPLEKEVYEQFRDYIEATKAKAKAAEQ